MADFPFRLGFFLIFSLTGRAYRAFSVVHRSEIAGAEGAEKVFEKHMPPVI